MRSFLRTAHSTALSDIRCRYVTSRPDTLAVVAVGTITRDQPRVAPLTLGSSNSAAFGVALLKDVAAVDQHVHDGSGRRLGHGHRDSDVRWGISYTVLFFLSYQCTRGSALHRAVFRARTDRSIACPTQQDISNW